jgi:DNA-binding beta-propeller fold protein YncE
MSSQGDPVVVESRGPRAAVIDKGGLIKLNLTVPGDVELWSVSRRGDILFITDTQTDDIHVLFENNTYVTCIITNLTGIVGIHITESAVWATTVGDELYKLTINKTFHVIKSDLFASSNLTLVFAWPYSLMVQYGRVVVICFGSHNIHVFDACGTRAHLFPPVGAWGLGNGQLNGPRDVVTDVYGNMYVAEQGGRVVVFSHTGQFKQNLVLRDKIAYGQPIALYLDNNTMYVLTADPYRIFVFLLVP